MIFKGIRSLKDDMGNNYLTYSHENSCFTTDGQTIAQKFQELNERLTILENGGVRVDVESLTIDKETINLSVGKTIKITATVLPANATNKNVIWQSTNETIATIDNQGQVFGVGVGECNISCTTVDGGFTQYCTIVISSQSIILNETFDTALTTNGWTTTGNSRVQGGFLLMEMDSADNSILKNITLANYTVSVDVTFVDKAPSIIFRKSTTDISNKQHYSYVILSGKVAVRKDSSIVVGVDFPLETTSGSVYTLKVVCDGNTVKCYCNDTLTHTFSDDTYIDNSCVGLYVYGYTTSKFDNFKVIG